MNRYDDLMTRCPRLGCEVTFGYCRIEQGVLPCSRIVACWRPSLPVELWLKQALSPEQVEQFLQTTGKDRFTTLFEITENLKKNR